MKADRLEAEALINVARQRVASYERSRFEELASDENLLAFVEARTLRAYENKGFFSQNPTPEPVSQAIVALMNDYLADRHLTFDERTLLTSRARAELAVLWSMSSDDPSRGKRGTKRQGSIYYDAFTDMEWVGRLILTATIPGSGKYVLRGVLDPVLLREYVKNDIDPDLAVSLG